MNSELEIALAFVAKREGRRVMPAAQWAHVLSFDLGWMPPAEARALVSGGVEAALLRPEGDDLRLTIDPGAVQVPRGFKPRTPSRPAPQASAQSSSWAAPKARAGTAPASVAGAGNVSPPAVPPGAAGAAPSAGAPERVDPFLDWVDKLATHNRSERRQVLDQVAALQERMGGQLTALAALLWLAARAGLDVREAAAAAKV